MTSLITTLLGIMIMFLVQFVLCGISNSKEFESQVMFDKRVWLVEFYSPKCSSCNEFAETWKDLSENMISVMSMKIDIEDKNYKEILEKLNIFEEGVPNVKLFAGTELGTSILKGLYMFV